MVTRIASLAVVLSATLLLWPTQPDRALGAAVWVPQAAAAKDESLAIIVNQSNSVENVSTEELRKIFLGERSHWPNGRRITLVMMEPGQPERKTMLRDICRMSESEFSRHFLHGLFTGEVFVSPKTLATPVGVRKFVFNVPGAIGYLRASDMDATVKVLRLDERLPEDKDYRLRVPLEPAK